jgi:hypothetical protein
MNSVCLAILLGLEIIIYQYLVHPLLRRQLFLHLEHAYVAAAAAYNARAAAAYNNREAAAYNDREAALPQYCKSCGWKVAQAEQQLSYCCICRTAGEFWMRPELRGSQNIWAWTAVNPWNSIKSAVLYVKRHTVVVAVLKSVGSWSEYVSYSASWYSWQNPLLIFIIIIIIIQLIISDRDTYLEKH